MKTYIIPAMEIVTVSAMNTMLALSISDKLPEGDNDNNQFSKQVDFSDEESVW